MNLYEMFETDTNVEKTGIVLEYGFNSDNKPIQIRIARAGGSNDAYTKRVDILLKPYRRQLQTDTMDKKVLEKLITQAVAETVVLGWENVQNRKGVVLDFTTENVIQLFTDLPQLRDDIVEQAQKISLFRKDLQEVEAKN